MDTLISLVIPAYNAEKYIARCLESAINQTYENYEIIVVNDGSTDQTLEICKMYENKCSFLRVLHRERNCGQTYSIQEGIFEAAGNYVTFMDSDDCLDSHYLEYLASGISVGAQIICCNCNKIYHNRVVLQKERIGQGIYDRDNLLKVIFPVLINDGTYLSRGISPHRCGKLFRRELLQNNLIFCDPGLRFGEDMNLTFAAMLDCNNLMILDDQEGLYQYYQNEGSMVHRYKKDMFEQIVLLRKKLLEIMDVKRVYDFKDQINRDFWSLFVDYVKNATKAANISAVCREVCLNFEVSQKEVPWLELKLKPADTILIFCLQRKLYGIVYLWMRLYSFLKKG